MQPRDDISIAFKQSQYATPHSDNTIPGNKPRTVLPQRLGRDYATTKCQLNSALIAPGGEGITAAEEHAAAAAVTAEAGERRQRGGGGGGQAQTHHHPPPQQQPRLSTSAAAAGPDAGAGHEVPPHGNGGGGGDGGGGHTRACLYGSERYILNVKHGGRRHFDEPRSAEAVWRPEMRIWCDYGPDTVRPAAVRRRGQGMFNLDSRHALHPSAAAALAAREQERARQESGKAMVAGPPSHTLEELGLWVREPGAAPVASAGTLAVAKQQTSGAESQPAVRTTRPTIESSMDRWGCPGGGRDAATEALVAAEAHRVPFDVNSSKRAERLAVDALRASRRARVVEATRRDDMEAVCKLPDM